MPKIMLVEDDNNLREIYEARLLAEGYEIVSAKDGEEALAMAVKEKPDLIISDVMMPKISGFDMLDILRSTPETRNTKVIMMTALSQSEDKARATKLGADRYLVKSQVTLEDVAKVAREVLSEEESPTAPVTTDIPQVATADNTATNTSTPIDDAATTNPSSVAPVAVNTPSTQVDPALAATLADEEAIIDDQVKDFVAQPAPPATPEDTPEKKTEEPPKNESDSLNQDTPISENTASQSSAEPVQISVKDAPSLPSDSDESDSPTDADKKKDEDTAKETEAVNNAPQEPASKPDENPNENNVPIANKKVIEPINDLTQKIPDLSELEAKENQKEALSPVQSQASNLPSEAVIQPGGAAELSEPKNLGDREPDNSENIILPSGHATSGTSSPADIAL